MFFTKTSVNGHTLTLTSLILTNFYYSLTPDLASYISFMLSHINKLSFSFAEYIGHQCC